MQVKSIRFSHDLEHFPKSGNRFLDKKCGKNKELEQNAILLNCVLL